NAVAQLQQDILPPDISTRFHILTQLRISARSRECVSASAAVVLESDARRATVRDIDPSVNAALDRVRKEIVLLVKQIRKKICPPTQFGIAPDDGPRPRHRTVY